jgi:predicted transcriptional regulator
MNGKRLSNVSRRAILGLLASVPAVWLLSAEAATVGEEAPNGKVVDVDDNKLWMRDLAGKTVIVFYEDKDSGEVNRALKDELKKLMGEDGMSAIRVVPIADVSEYNSWPARGFVKDAIREESKKNGLTIWCDWDASYRKAYDLEKGTSNVVVIGKDGLVKVSTSGAVKESRRKEILAMLKADVSKKKD